MKCEIVLQIQLLKWEVPGLEKASTLYIYILDFKLSVFHGVFLIGTMP